MTTDLPIVTETDDDADASTPEAIATATIWRERLGDEWQCAPDPNGGFAFWLGNRAPEFHVDEDGSVDFYYSVDRKLMLISLWGPPCG